MPKVAFAANKSSSQEVMDQFLRDGFAIDLIITLTPAQAERFHVSGYKDLRPFAAAHGIEIYHPTNYNLKSANDRERLGAEGIDALFVDGWQRLIPPWFLEALPLGAFGMHGSAEPLPRGRGRSPINWSLLEGRRSFLAHLFRYDEGVDSGEIVAVQRFDLTVWDDCDSATKKERVALSKLLREYAPAILRGERFTPQPTDIAPTYYGKRSPEDGRVRWADLDMARLFNHIRCQTRPFPGAFSHRNGAAAKTWLWKGVPFDTHLTFLGARPGDVVEVFEDGSFLVAVWDGTVYVTDWEAEDGTAPQRGDRLWDFPEGTEPADLA